MKKALLINKGNADNLGDQAIKYVLEKMLINSGFEVDFVDFTFDQSPENLQFKESAELEGAKDASLSPIRKLNRNLLKYSLYRNLMWSVRNRNSLTNIKFSNHYDLVMIGGGQLILSNSTFPSALLKWVRFIRKNFQNSKIVIFGVGVGGGFKFYEQKLEIQALKLIDQIYLRDHKSIKVMEEELSYQSKYTPDVVFNLSNVHPTSLEKKNRVLIGVTDYYVYKRYNSTGLSKEQYYTQWIDYVKKYKNLGYDIELFYTSVRDLSESIKFQKYLMDNLGFALPIAQIDNLNDLIKLIATSKVVISGRMHGLIIGYTYKCKVIPYVLSEKIETFNEEYVENTIKISDIQTQIMDSFNEAIQID